MSTKVPTEIEAPADRDAILVEIQNRALWLSVQMVHHANNVRLNSGGGKVGGHQASSSSVATVLTSLYFDFMTGEDRISIKPHASPIFHAIQFLLGNLEPSYLKTLRGFHGLQAYPSRTKDPDHVDFSTGSVGLGAVAPNFAALVHEYTSTHIGFSSGPSPRYISVVGDAELDEGSVWEAIAEPSMEGLKNILWVIDLNRQSLDRIIPGIRARAWRDMFLANGWNVVDAKYGKHLQAAFALPNGELLKKAIDDMPNEVYQRLLRVTPDILREWLPCTSSHPLEIGKFIGQWDDIELQQLFRNLGGHDFSMLREAFAQTDLNEGPSVVFAYTLKGWMLPSVGDPQNHSVAMSSVQVEELREQLDISEDSVWSGFDPESLAGQLCSETSQKLNTRRTISGPSPGPFIPAELGHVYRGDMSTQQIYGLVLTDISRNLRDVSNRIVTVSPDVASSTNLGGWINKVGVWARADAGDLPEEGVPRALKWDETPDGQHIEFGISENNLFNMMGQLGLSYEMNGELLFPIGTLYDPFVTRGLDAFCNSVYSGARFIVVGTPSGITLSPEGGAHQSVITPSVGVELPELAFYEPCFGQELEWIMLGALEDIRLRRQATYLRLTSKRVDQSLLKVPSDPVAREQLRIQVLEGAYRLVDRSADPDYKPGVNVVNLLACGAMLPEAVSASYILLEEGLLVNVINVTGPGPLYKKFQESVRATIAGDRRGDSVFMSDVIPLRDRSAPVVTVVDGHPHSLAWVGTALNARTLPLGVSGFGQSGSRTELYREYGIDIDSIVAACFAAVEL